MKKIDEVLKTATKLYGKVNPLRLATYAGSLLSAGIMEISPHLKFDAFEKALKLYQLHSDARNY